MLQPKVYIKMKASCHLGGSLSSSSLNNYLASHNSGYTGRKGSTQIHWKDLDITLFKVLNFNNEYFQNMRAVDMESGGGRGITENRLQEQSKIRREQPRRDKVKLRVLKS